MKAYRITLRLMNSNADAIPIYTCVLQAIDRNQALYEFSRHMMPPLPIITMNFCAQVEELAS